MAWTITLDVGTIGMIGSALVSAGFALWYVAKAHSHVQSIPRIDRQLQRLRNEVERLRRLIEGHEDDEPAPHAEGPARKRIESAE